MYRPTVLYQRHDFKFHGLLRRRIFLDTRYVLIFLVDLLYFNVPFLIAFVRFICPDNNTLTHMLSLLQIYRNVVSVGMLKEEQQSPYIFLNI